MPSSQTIGPFYIPGIFSLLKNCGLAHNSPLGLSSLETGTRSMWSSPMSSLLCEQAVISLLLWKPRWATDSRVSHSRGHT